MFLTRKPRPLGNERHTICCCLYVILLQCELVEFKAGRPKEKLNEDFSDIVGATIGLLLLPTKIIFHMAKVFIFDIRFGVLISLIDIQKRGIFDRNII